MNLETPVQVFEAVVASGCIPYRHYGTATDPMPEAQRLGLIKTSEGHDWLLDDYVELSLTTSHRKTSWLASLLDRFSTAFGLAKA